MFKEALKMHVNPQRFTVTVRPGNTKTNLFWILLNKTMQIWIIVTIKILAYGARFYNRDMVVLSIPALMSSTHREIDPESG